MKGLKCKRKFTRTLYAPSSMNQKTTNFDYAAFCKENEMRANENAHQVHAAIAPAKVRSPLSKVKRDHSVLMASLGASAKKQRILTAKCHRGQEKITYFKRINNQLMIDILQEKQVSNRMINKAMSVACKLSGEAVEMINNATVKINKAKQ